MDPLPLTVIQILRSCGVQLVKINQPYQANYYWCGEVTSAGDGSLIAVRSYTILVPHLPHLHLPSSSYCSVNGTGIETQKKLVSTNTVNTNTISVPFKAFSIQ